MSGPDLCPKCKGLHFRNAPCIVRKPNAELARLPASKDGNGSTPGKTEVRHLNSDNPKRGPGRPKTITDMAAYKAAKQRQYRARKKASATEETK